MPIVHFSHIESFCGEIGKYPVVVTTRRVNRCKTWDFFFLICCTVPSVHLFYHHVSTFCQWLRYVSQFEQFHVWIFLQLTGKLNCVLTNHLSVIIHMLMRWNNIETIGLKSHCYLQDDDFPMHSPWVWIYKAYLCQMRGVSMILQFPRIIKIFISLLSLSPSMRHGFQFLL